MELRNDRGDRTIEWNLRVTESATSRGRRLAEPGSVRSQAPGSPGIIRTCSACDKVTLAAHRRALDRADRLEHRGDEALPDRLALVDREPSALEFADRPDAPQGVGEERSDGA